MNNLLPFLGMLTAGLLGCSNPPPKPPPELATATQQQKSCIRYCQGKYSDCNLSCLPNRGSGAIGALQRYNCAENCNTLLGQCYQTCQLDTSTTARAGQSRGWQTESTADDAYAAFDRGDYKIALRGLKPLAENGDTDAQIKLGVMYHGGKGVRRDYTEAMKWFRKAANQGDAEAQAVLGVMYLKGEGIQRDYVEAVRWIRKAANQNLASAQVLLGGMYERGVGVSRNYRRAYVWYILGSSQSHS
jgi:uncharacterized protein